MNTANDLPDQHPGQPRRALLKCMLWGGTGVLWTVSGGIPRSRLIGAALAADETTDFSFIQISDSHIGFANALAGRPVAALVYKHREHVIDVFVAPDTGHLGVGAAIGNRSGYNYLSGRSDGMVFWVVSDLNADELADFVRVWHDQ